MALPTFLLIGAGRCGTTSIYHYLAQHPDVFMSAAKEPGYFALAGQRGKLRGPHARALQNRYIFERDAYERLFEGSEAYRAAGEASPRYLDSMSAALRVRRVLPGVKLAAILRHPVERIYRSYVAARRDGIEPESDFRSALRDEPRRTREGWGWLRYVWLAKVGRDLKVWFDLFPREDIRIYLFEDLCHDPQALMRDLYAHIGVDPNFSPNTDVHHNPTGVLSDDALSRIWRSTFGLRLRLRPYLPQRLRELGQRLVERRQTQRPALDAALRADLTAQLRPDIMRLQRLIGRDLGHWLA